LELEAKKLEDMGQVLKREMKHIV